MWFLLSWGTERDFRKDLGRKSLTRRPRLWRKGGAARKLMSSSLLLFFLSWLFGRSSNPQRKWGVLLGVFYNSNKWSLIWSNLMKLSISVMMRWKSTSVCHLRWSSPNRTGLRNPDSLLQRTWNFSSLNYSQLSPRKHLLNEYSLSTESTRQPWDPFPSFCL